MIPLILSDPMNRPAMSNPPLEGRSSAGARSRALGVAQADDVVEVVLVDVGVRVEVRHEVDADELLPPPERAVELRVPDVRLRDVVDHEGRVEAVARADALAVELVAVAARAADPDRAPGDVRRLRAVGLDAERDLRARLAHARVEDLR